nr:hypothetical protein DGKKSRWO_DGKKSRWO_CDS_0120 [uncultured phage]CAI9752297.1 hypothetical protein CVNMHQAP_CVNMHQAP_CDS_0120 [uncultured phage]
MCFLNKIFYLFICNILCIIFTFYYYFWLCRIIS